MRPFAPRDGIFPGHVSLAISGRKEDDEPFSEGGTVIHDRGQEESESPAGDQGRQ